MDVLEVDLIDYPLYVCSVKTVRDLEKVNKKQLLFLLCCLCQLLSCIEMTTALAQLWHKNQINNVSCDMYGKLHGNI